MAMSRIGTSLRRCVRYASSEAGEFRKPMINFNAKTRKSHQEVGQPHPCAPDEISNNFADFGKRTPPKQPSSSASSSSSPPKPSSSSSSGLPQPDFEEFFQAPARYWRPPAFEESEIEAIMSGGATITSRP